MLKPIILTAAGAALFACSASATTLLGYYPFEGNYDDASGNANHAAPAQNPGEVSIVASGFRGQGADINDPAASGGGNTGGSIDIPINANPNESPQISFGGWVNLETLNGFNGFMAVDNGGWDRGMTINSSGGAFGIASGNAPVLGGAATPGNWQFVVGTFNKPGNVRTLYVGDAASATATTIAVSGNDAGNNPGEVNIEVGRYDNQDMDGRVDDLFVFANELTAFQANAIRNLRLSGLDYSPLHANDLFNLFDAGGSGNVGGLNWSPAGGLDPTNPGEVFDLGGGQWGLVLDGNGNGLVGIPEPTAPLLGALGALFALMRRRRS